MDSQRFPGKTLLNVGGQPLLTIVVQRCRKVQHFADRVIVATTSRAEDDSIADYCHDANLHLYRGEVNDVAGRSLAAAEEFELDWFARVNGDSPFVEPALLDKACEIATQRPLDFVTNLSPRSYPYGVSVELIRTKKYRELYPRFEAPFELEHMTHYLYRNLDALRYHSLAYEKGDLSGIRLTIDIPEELDFFERLCRDVGAPLVEISFQRAAEAYLAMKADS